MNIAKIKQDCQLVRGLMNKYNITSHPMILCVDFKNRENMLNLIFQLNSLNRKLYEYNCKYKLISKQKETGYLQYSLIYDPFVNTQSSYYDYVENHLFPIEMNNYETLIDAEKLDHLHFRHFFDELEKHNLFDIEEDREHIKKQILYCLMIIHK